MLWSFAPNFSECCTRWIPIGRSGHGDCRSLGALLQRASDSFAELCLVTLTIMQQAVALGFFRRLQCHCTAPNPKRKIRDNEAGNARVSAIAAQCFVLAEEFAAGIRWHSPLHNCASKVPGNISGSGIEMIIAVRGPIGLNQQ